MSRPTTARVHMACATCGGWISPGMTIRRITGHGWVCYPQCDPKAQA